jgi:hypothetical protein
LRGVAEHGYCADIKDKADGVIIFREQGGQLHAFSQRVSFILAARKPEES